MSLARSALPERMLAFGLFGSHATSLQRQARCRLRSAAVSVSGGSATAPVEQSKALGDAAEESSEGLLLSLPLKKRQKVSMMSLGCPKNVVDGTPCLLAVCEQALICAQCCPPATGEVMLGDLFREGFDITARACVMRHQRNEIRGLRSLQALHFFSLHTVLLSPTQASHEEADAIVVNTCAFIDEARLLSSQPIAMLRAATASLHARRSRSRSPQSSRLPATRRTARLAA
jgi:hypothetical protein